MSIPIISTKKPRVLILIDTYPVGGPGKLLVQFLKSQAAKEIQPFIVGFFRGPERPWPFREAILNINKPFYTLEQAFAFDPRVIFRAKNLVEELEIDLIESHGYKSHVVALFLRLWTHCKWISYVHGWTRENFKILFYNWIEKRVAPYADLVWTVSKQLRQELELNSKTISKVQILHNAIDLQDELIEQNSKDFELSDRPVILAVGRLSPEKGFGDLIEALALLKQRGIHCKLILVGEGPERDTLQRQVVHLDVQDLIHFAGYQTDLTSWWQKSEIFCLPSRQEGIPLVLLEAMAHKRPIVATTVGGVPEVLISGRDGILVRPQQPNDIAEGILQIIKSPPTQIQRMIQNSFAKVQSDFAQEARAQKIVTAYKQLILRHTTKVPPRS